MASSGQHQPKPAFLGADIALDSTASDRFGGLRRYMAEFQTFIERVLTVLLPD